MSALHGMAWLLVGAMMTGCGASTTTRVVVPLQGNAAGEVAAESCVLHCRASSSIERCMASCPGAVVLSGACRRDEAPPVAMCRVSEDGPLVYRVNASAADYRRPAPDAGESSGGGESGSAVGEVVGELLTSAVGAALSSGSSSSPGSSEPSRASSPSPTGVRMATRSEPVRSSSHGDSSSSRTSASPSRGESSSGRTAATPKHSEPSEKPSRGRH